MTTIKLFSDNIDRIIDAIKNDNVSVCVIGIGRIGLPTALSFAKSGLPTIGVDINKDLVQKIKAGKFPLKDEPGYDKIFEEVITNGRFSVSTDLEQVVPNCNIILLSLPTPMNENRTPDYSALKTVGSQLSKLLKEDSIVIVESTIEPGFIENEFVKIIEGDKTRIEAGRNFGLGVCPETANPGEIMTDFKKLPRLVGAIDQKTTQIIMEIYKHVFPVELIKMPNCKTANAVKLTTNIFRDINIAFVNELSSLFEKLGIDTFEVLEAAKKKYNFQVHYPGAGVGGPCLPVNSYQMINSANNIDVNFLKLVRMGRKINEAMPLHVVELLNDALLETNKKINSCKILILGVSYKPNVKDIQLSPAEVIVSRLKELGAEVKIYDPYFISTEIYNIMTEGNLDNILNEVDAVVIITAHKEFLDLSPEYFAMRMKLPIIIDSRGIIENQSAKKSGVIFRGLGRGNST